MKTLTEVIEALERCGTYPNCHFCFLHAGPVCGWIRDALSYLKMYKELADDSEAFAEWKENPPLTWDELKQMEGKPVWIDSVPLVRRWVIIKKFHPIGGNKNLFDMEVEDGAHFLRKNMRRDDPAWWQAYRKERRNERKV